MSTLKELQNSFIDFLRDEQSTLEKLVVDQKPVPIDTRLHIYKNAYRERLKEVIGLDHEILSVYLGHELFDQMAYGYIAKYPSTFTSLRELANRLPVFLSETHPFSDIPALAELASFERHLLQVFDAADTPVKVFKDLLAIEPRLWPEMRLRFHPSTQIQSFTWNIIPIWQALKADQTPPEREQIDSIWLLWRGTDRLSSFISIQTDEQAALNAFLHGQDFAQVCEVLNEWHAEEAVGEVAVGLLNKWFEIGLIREIVTNQNSI